MRGNLNSSKEPILDSKEKDAAFCFVCYLFKSSCTSGGEAFVNEGFRTWSKTSAFDIHVEVKSDYRIRLETSIEALRFLCLQGLAARGHKESDQSLNQGNFLELLKLMAKRNSNVARVVLEKTPGNCTLTSSQIQKDIVSAFAKETTKKIIEELDGSFFAILADESADISDKEQMALCLRYVDKMGKVKERLLGIVRVGDTTSLTLKAAIEKLLIENSLTLSSVRGQGYDGASNMRGSINGLKTLILNESPSAYYVHCFAHQLQLTLVAVAKKNVDCSVLFYSLAILLNVVGAEHVLKELNMGEIASGTGLNQEKGLSRPGDTRWGSHFKTILNVFALYSAILDVLDAIGEFCDGRITNVLSLALQRRDQDIVNAIALVDSTKRNLQKIRDDGWDVHMEKVESFCLKHEISIPTMDDVYVNPGRYKRGRKNETNLHHFRVEVFLSLIDQILQEIDSRFDEVSKELLICMSCFNLSDQFSSFDITKLVYLLLKLVLLLPVATAERAFSAMTYIKNRLRNSMGDQLDLFCEISDEDIVNHFQNMRTRRLRLD
ncbi:hypothetical protein RND81_02G140000 [Saponaria officinalis]|uniref:DUF4371 domain-containing protein n=1 Tax=Saponaria officinalis TaxID=3572 RepID=A0AAW1MUE1_SAPOF